MWCPYCEVAVRKEQDDDRIHYYCPECEAYWYVKIK